MLKLVLTPLGYIGLNIKDEVEFTEDFNLDKNVIIEEILSIEKKKITENTKKVISKISKFSEIIIYDENLYEVFVNYHKNIKLEHIDTNVINFLNNLKNYYIKKYNKTEEEYYAFLKEINEELTKARIRNEQQVRDKIVIQVINSIDDLNKTINLLVNRLIEWYGLYFPELYNILKNNELFVKLIAIEPFKEKLNEETFSKLNLSKEKIEKILKAAKTSVGAEFPSEDILTIKEFTKQILDLYEVKKNLESYLEELMKTIAPNLTAIVGPTIGARLIAKADGFKKLVTLPASTIQVLGAEKALFKHLKLGTKPPKHGIIFQHSLVHSAPKWQRGKIARLLANKIAIACRVDYFSQKYIADEILKEIENKLEIIKKTTKPKVKKEKSK